MTALAMPTIDAGGELLVQLAAFPRLTDTRPRPVSLPWAEVARRLTDFEERAEKDGAGYSPAIYRPGTTRRNDAVEALTAVVLDIDYDVPTWELLEGFEYVAHTTFHHLRDKDGRTGPHWRIVLPLARAVSADEWPEVWERVRFRLCPNADDSCKDVFRFYWKPAHQPGAPYDARRGYGRPVDPDALPVLPPVAPRPTTQASASHSGRPGDDFAAATEWRGILEPHGWKRVYERGEEEAWRRPGKREGISATVNYKGSGLLYVFSSNAAPFEPNTSYTKFGAYAVLEHDGDFTTATKVLAARGYGAPELGVDLGERTNGQRTPQPLVQERELSERSEVSTAPAQESALSSPNSLNSRLKTWPKPLADEAFHGLAGDTVALFAPHTESDQAAILTQFLAAFANAVGPTPHIMVGPTRHGARLSVIVAGDTARARKGDSWQCVRSVFRSADPDWLEKSVSTGLSTGEGLISVVRDASIDTSTGIASEAADRRVLAVETEFGRPLRAMAREGNTLSAVLRDAWDGRDLAVMTRGTPLRATDAHISIIGHITIPELRRELSATDAHNGFANRLLWVCARRSQFLADPIPVPPDALAEVASRVTAALGRARGMNALMRDEETREVWQTLYPLLTEDREGLAGDVLARSEAQVLRLSMVYALLDGSRLIRLPHLVAALAVWDYCAASVAHIFGDASGDAVADEIMRHLTTGGELSRTDISNRLGRHVRAERIRLALDTLEQSGYAARRSEGTEGRPVELWRATGKPKQGARPLLPLLAKEANKAKEGEAR